MRPIISYLGGKYRLAKKYGPPQFDHVVEPFAGGAGYSLFWEPKHVTLVEKRIEVASIWQFLIASPGSEILRLPLNIPNVRETDLPDGAKFLIGFWFGQGKANSCHTPGKWSRWNKDIRARIADTADAISHWTIIHGDYTKAPDLIAHWFIDPPYQSNATMYRCEAVDYNNLSSWVRQRRGRVQVCENEKADWLTFHKLTNAQNTPSCSRNTFSSEYLWER